MDRFLHPHPGPCVRGLQHMKHLDRAAEGLQINPHPTTLRREQQNTATANTSLKFTQCLFTARRVCGQPKTLLALAGPRNKIPA